MRFLRPAIVLLYRIRYTRVGQQEFSPYSDRVSIHSGEIGLDVLFDSSDSNSAEMTLKFRDETYIE